MNKPTFSELSKMVTEVFTAEVDDLQIYIKAEDLIEDHNALLVIEMKKQTSEYKFEFEFPVITPEHDQADFVNDLLDIRQALFYNSGS